jgi:hypothetical protein
MPVYHSARSARRDDQRKSSVPANGSRLLDALEAENTQLRDTVAALALETAILRERLQQE